MKREELMLRLNRNACLVDFPANSQEMVDSLMLLGQPVNGVMVKMPTPLPEGYLTPFQVCQLFCIHASTLKRWVKEGKLKRYRQGPQISFFKRDELPSVEEYLKIRLG